MADTLQKMKVTGSRAAGTVTRSVREAMESAKSGWDIKARTVAWFAVSLVPVIGLGASYLIERNKNSKIESNQKEVLAKYYRNQIAAQLRMDPNKVNASHLDLINPKSTLGLAIAKVKHEKDNANRSAAFSTGGAALATTFIPIPGAGTLAQMGLHTAGSIGGSVVSSAFNKDVLHTQDVIEHLDEKLGKKEAITAADIVTLRISQDEELQKALTKQNGTAFHKMNEAQQRAVIVGMPDMRDAKEIADAVNEGRVDVQDVLMMKPQKPSWTQRVGESRARQAGSFVEQENSRRAQAQLAANTIS